MAVATRISKYPMMYSTQEERISVTEGLDLDAVYHAPYRPRVLIIDDDPDIVFLLKTILREASFDVSGAYSCEEALAKCEASKPDVILLDLMMPNLDGWLTYEQLRQITDAPIMIISALSSRDTVVKGLEIGAEDYVTKPFYNEEVITRIKKIIQRSKSSKAPRMLNFPKSQLCINSMSREVIFHGERIHLTAREYAVLETLAEAAPRTVRYEDIAQKVWGEDTPDVRKSIKYIIYLLRRKLEIDPTTPTLIVNSERFGYKLITEVNNQINTV